MYRCVIQEVITFVILRVRFGCSLVPPVQIHGSASTFKSPIRSFPFMSRSPYDPFDMFITVIILGHSTANTYGKGI